MARTKEELEAIRNVRRVDLVVDRGSRQARRITDKLRREIIKQYRRGRFDLDIRQYLQDNFFEELRDAMIVSHLQSIQDTPIRASIFTQLIRQLGRATDSNIDELQNIYDTQALAVLDGVANNIEAELRETVNELISSGAHIREAREILGRRFDALGLTTDNSYQLETIFRTQSSLAFNAARWQNNQDPVTQEILWGYTYVTVGDDRVRETHAALDGTTLPKEDPFWQTYWPPNGWNCRCQVISVFEERKEVRPPDTVNGEPVVPDDGFSFNPGIVFST